MYIRKKKLCFRKIYVAQDISELCNIKFHKNLATLNKMCLFLIFISGNHNKQLSCPFEVFFWGQIQTNTEIYILAHIYFRCRCQKNHLVLVISHKFLHAYMLVPNKCSTKVYFCKYQVKTKNGFVICLIWDHCCCWF